jgi:hypothetical protein
MPWQGLAEKPLFKPKSQAFLLSEPKPSMMVLSRQPQPVTPRLAQNGGCPNSSFAKVVRVGAHYRPVAGGNESPWGRGDLDWQELTGHGRQRTPTLSGKSAIEMVGVPGSLVKDILFESSFVCINQR